MDINFDKLTPQWMAGFFDGEGSVSAYLDPRGVMKLDVHLSQSHFPIIAAIAAKFGVSPTHQCRSKKPTVRNCYGIHFTGRKAKKFLEYIKDHVIVKREQVALALEFVKLIGKSGNGASKDPEVWNRRKTLGQQIRNLNHVNHDLVDDHKGGYVS